MVAVRKEKVINGRKTRAGGREQGRKKRGGRESLRN